MSDRRNRALSALITLGFAAALVACSPREETPQPSDQASSDAGTPPGNGAATTSESGDVKSFSIGKLSAKALRDGNLEIPNDNSVFGVGHTRAEVGALLTADGLPSDELELSIQPLLVETPDRVLLFDTGAGANMGTSGGRLPASMAAAGVEPGRITDIFISHVHGDHVGGLVDARGNLVFPNAVIHISAPEWEFLQGMDAEAAASVGIGRHPALVAAMAPAVAGFAPDAEIIPGVVKAVAIPGHTPGHSGYLITSGEESLLYVGDAVHHWVVSVQRPDWTCGFDGDARTAAASRRELLARSAAGGQRLYAVHFPFPGLGKVERRADGFAWIPE